MDWLELTIRYLGIGLLSTICLALIAGALLCIAFVVIRFTPRLHYGKPTNDGELCFYDYRSIIRGKDGKPIDGERRLVNAPLAIKWWFGLSRRNSAKWFIGVIRWDPKS